MNLQQFQKIGQEILFNEDIRNFITKEETMGCGMSLSRYLKRPYFFIAMEKKPKTKPPKKVNGIPIKIEIRKPARLS